MENDQTVTIIKIQTYEIHLLKKEILMIIHLHGKMENLLGSTTKNKMWKDDADCNSGSVDVFFSYKFRQEDIFMSEKHHFDNFSFWIVYFANH